MRLCKAGWKCLFVSLHTQNPIRINPGLETNSRALLEATGSKREQKITFTEFSATRKLVQSTCEAPRIKGLKMEYGPIPSSKFEDVIHHLRYNFPDEPLNASVGLCVHGKPCELLEHHDLLTMQDGLSVMAVDKATGEIAGVALNGIARRGDVEKSLEEMKTIDNIKYQRIFGLLNNVNKTADLFNKYNVDKIFELRILSVDSRFRGKGIAKELFRKSELVAQENGFKLIKVDATSLFTQRVAECIGCTVEKSVKYGDYKDENGQKIYDTKSPHDYYKVMIKLISDKTNDG